MSAASQQTPAEKVIRVGSRKSELALIQTKHVIGRLQKLFPKQKFEIHTMSTFGDRVLNISLPKIGEKSLFTRDLEDALRNGGVDFVVHSLKDLPTALPLGMAVGAVLEREDARDALVLRENHKGLTIATLPKGSVIGTSSLRRTAQIRRLYPHLVVCDIRGNLNTRLAKLDAADSKFSGIILAQAGLVRMGWMNRISQVLEPTDLLYAVGQGALAVECRSNDTPILNMLQKLMCLSTTCRILAERSFLKTLGGGCSAPVAVWSNLKGEPLTGCGTEDIGLSLTGAVWSLDGVTEIRDHLACALNETQRRKRAAEQEQEQEDMAVEGNGRGVGNGNNNSTGSSSNDSSCDSPPATKRARNDPTSSTPSPTSNSSSPPQRGSPPVINDDAEVEQLTTNYNVEELIERHIDLARECPVVGNNNNINQGAGDGGGGGDADSSNANATPHCPWQMGVGQDFMGRCPVVDNETKVAYAKDGKCPLTHNILPATATITTTATATTTANASGGDVPDNVATAPAASKCPFAALHQGSGLEPPKVTVDNDNGAGVSSHQKCPFLQKTVQMFDYADEEQPKPQQLHQVLIEDVDLLFCGLYPHTCHSRELYVRSNQLGQTLAEQLIEKGALDVMKVAQAEIHSKAS